MRARRVIPAIPGRARGFAAQTVARHIYDALQRNGVENVFGFTGGAVLPLTDCFHDGKINFFMSTNEQCAGHSAAAVGRTTGKTGVCIVTSGPGCTNTVTALQDALQDGVPMVLLTGQVPTTAMGTDAFQECPATGITRFSTKWNTVVMDPSQALSAIATAFAVAQQGRPGPVHVDLPKDVLISMIDLPPTSRPSLPKTPNPEVPDELIAEAADRLNKSERPVLLVGQGASDCSELIRDFAKKGQYPVSTTCHGMGIFDERDPLSLKMMGMHGAAYANILIQEADAIINIGGRFDDRTTGVTSKYAPLAKIAGKEGRGGIMHCDIRREAIGRVVQPDVGMHGDCAAVLEALIPRIKAPSELPTHLAVARDKWLKQVAETKAAHPLTYRRLADGRIKTQQAIEMINRVGTKMGIMDNCFVTTGVGNHQMMAAQFIDWIRPRSYVSSGSLGTMGVGLPFAIGAQVANPNSTVILVDGDGSFNMNCGDLSTVKRYNLPVKIAIMNDGRQQMVWVWQKLFHGERYMATENTNPCYRQFVESFGIGYHTVDNESNLEEATRKWLSADGPQVMDFRCVPDICLPMVAPGKGLDEMILMKDYDQIWGNEMEFTGMAPS